VPFSVLPWRLTDSTSLHWGHFIASSTMTQNYAITRFKALPDFLVGGFYFCRAHSGRLLFQFVRKGIRVQDSEAPGNCNVEKLKMANRP
jgi:hypothetical protein